MKTADRFIFTDPCSRPVFGAATPKPPATSKITGQERELVRQLVEAEAKRIRPAQTTAAAVYSARRQAVTGTPKPEAGTAAGSDIYSRRRAQAKAQLERKQAQLIEDVTGIKRL